MLLPSYVPSEVSKLIISSSSLKTCQLVILFGIEGLKINSNENLSGIKSSGGTRFEGTF
jgi:hypothetical protein